MKLETWKPVNSEENLPVAEDQTEEDFAKSDSFEANDSAIDDLLHDEQDSLKIMENASSDGGPPVKRKKAAKKQPARDPRTINKVFSVKRPVFDIRFLDPRKP